MTLGVSLTGNFDTTSSKWCIFFVRSRLELTCLRLGVLLRELRSADQMLSFRLLEVPLETAHQVLFLVFRLETLDSLMYALTSSTLRSDSAFQHSICCWLNLRFVRLLPVFPILNRLHYERVGIDGNCGLMNGAFGLPMVGEFFRFLERKTLRCLY